MISNLTQEVWDKKTIELGGSILQSWGWGEFNQDIGHKIHRFSGEDSICLAVEHDLPMGKKYIYCPRGPLGNKENALVDLKKFSEDHKIIFTRVEPLQQMPLPRALKDVQPTHNWVLPIEKSEEDLLIEMKPKTRYNINLAERRGVVVKEGRQEDLLNFFRLMLETATRNQFKLHPQSYYIQMWDHLSSQNLKLILAYYNNQLLAGILMSTFGTTATYLHGGSSEKMKDTMAPFLLHWSVIRLAKQLGMKSYDFGGIAPGGEANHPWNGITRFKKGFGGVEVIYPGAFDLVYSPIWYNVYKQGRKLSQSLFR